MTMIIRAGPTFSCKFDTKHDDFHLGKVYEDAKLVLVDSHINLWIFLHDILYETDLDNLEKAVICDLENLCGKSIANVSIPGGGGTQHTHTAGQFKEYSGNPKIPVQLHCNTKISANLTFKHL